MLALPTTLPPLETTRLRLRAMRADDAAALFAIYGDPQVMRYAGGNPLPAPGAVWLMLQSVERWRAEGQSLEWGMEERVTGLLIGTCGLHSVNPHELSIEVGCMLARAAWGHGYMREALTPVIAYARDTLGVASVRADIAAANVRSLQLFARLGFTGAGPNTYELVF